MHPFTYHYATLAVISILGAISPGPDFAVVIKCFFSGGRTSAIACALGIGLGILIHSTYCILGLGLILIHTPWLYHLIQYAGALYLIYLGGKNLFTASTAITSGPDPANTDSKHPHRTKWDGLKTGLLTNVLNPKCALFMLSLFTVVITPDTPHWIKASYGLEIAGITAAWFVFLAYALGHKRLQPIMQRGQALANRGIGLVLIALGLIVLLKAWSH